MEDLDLEEGEAVALCGRSFEDHPQKGPYRGSHRHAFAACSQWDLHCRGDQLTGDQSIEDGAFGAPTQCIVPRARRLMGIRGAPYEEHLKDYRSGALVCLPFVRRGEVPYGVYEAQAGRLDPGCHGSGVHWQVGLEGALHAQVCRLSIRQGSETGVKPSPP